MNKVLLLGRLGADAELRVTAGGTSICKFSLATSEKFKDKEGKQQERTEWHRCQLWGDRGEKLSQYLTKGKQLLVEGSIQYGKYEKDGQTLYTTDIRVNNVEFAGDGGKGSEARKPEGNDNAPPPASTGFGGDDFGGGSDDDIPF